MTLRYLARSRSARLLLGVTLVAGFGSTAMSLVSSVWVLSLTGSASLAALTGLCVYAPSLAGPLIGTAVDRLPRRRLLIGTSLALAALLLTLFAVRAAGDVWLIFVVMVGYGVSYVTLDAGEVAIAQAVLPREQLGELNSVRMTVQESMKLVAPLAGAALFAWAGGAPVAGLAAGCLLLAAALYASVPIGQTVAAAAGPVLGQTRDGLRFLFRQPDIRPLVLIASVTVGMTGLTIAANFVVLTGDLHRAPAFAGVLAAAQGAGSIAGGLVGGRLLTRFGESAVAGLGATLAAVAMLGLSVPVTGVVVAARMLLGVGLPWTVIAAFTAVQQHTGPTLIGRVAASASTLIFAPVTVTTTLGAGLITVIDHRLVPVVAAAVTLAGLALVRHQQARAVRLPTPRADRQRHVVARR